MQRNLDRVGDNKKVFVFKTNYSDRVKDTCVAAVALVFD